MTLAYNNLEDRMQQSYAGNMTTYLFDIASYLPQVLADGDSTYLYGLGRIGEEGIAGWQYHHGDALGSVRQLTNLSGAATLAKSYEPYGELLNSAGDVDTPYDFAGEWRDNTGLIYLRARFYEPTVGRFISRDSWGGDNFRPNTLNWWNYGYSNPIRYADPSGLVPTEEEILSGRHIYSCNCGWIDFGHANPANGMDIFRLLDSKPAPLQNIPVRENILLVTMHMYFPPLPIRVDLNTVIRQDLMGKTRDAVALGMFMSREGFREWLQAPSFWARTSFSEEDLTSNLIGFYMGVIGMEDARTNNLSWRWLSTICNFPENREEAKEWSLDVFREYPKYEKIRHWGAPRLVCTSAINQRCSSTRSWPTQFTTIEPEKSQVGGNWWWYRGIFLDGFFLTTDIPDVYFLYDY